MTADNERDEWSVSASLRPQKSTRRSDAPSAGGDYRGLVRQASEEPLQLISFPTEAYFILQERLVELEREGVKMPVGVGRDELALRILIAAETGQVPRLAVGRRRTTSLLPSNAQGSMSRLTCRSMSRRACSPHHSS
jgi:hypothetical protein